MPFEKGHEYGVRFNSEHQPTNNGRPLGSKSRSTIARKVLEMTALLPNQTLEKLKEVYPEIGDKLTAEEIATIVMVGNAISKGDVNAYKAVMDSAYGAPKVEVKNTVNAQLFPLDPLSDIDDNTAIESPSENSGVTQTD